MMLFPLIRLACASLLLPGHVYALRVPADVPAVASDAAGPVDGGVVSASDSVIALVGGTVIDGNGGAPLVDATVIVVGDRISKIGPRRTTAIPAGARRIDARGKYLTPGFIDTNVHVTPYTGAMLVDHTRNGMIRMALDAAQQFMSRGVTTIRDTYGYLVPDLAARDSLKRGSVVGARLLIAGNIIGLGTKPTGGLTQGVGRNLLGISDDSLRVLIDRYLAKGVDFIKISVTDHNSRIYNPKSPEPLLFSASALETMVREAHQRGDIVDSHVASPAGIRAAVGAGVNVLQHPELMWDDSVPQDVVQLLAKGRVICALMPAHYTGRNWTNPENRKVHFQHRQNAEKLIHGGCPISVSTDDWFLMGGLADTAQDLAPGNIPSNPWGEVTLQAIEGLVELGMTPAQALTAATRNGAIAAGGAKEYGTLEAGKAADLLVLGANPLTDIHNIRRLEMVFHQGHILVEQGSPSAPPAPGGAMPTLPDQR